MPKLLRYGLQAVNYTVFMALIWYFSTSPAVTQLEENQAVVTMAFGHQGQLREPCRQLSAEELAQLPPNMRIPSECPRERSPVVIELLMDRQQLFRDVIDPPGLFQDGGVNVFHATKIPSGKHLFEVRMNDSVQVEGYNHQHQQEAELAPSQLMVIDFDPEQGFIFK